MTLGTPGARSLKFYSLFLDPTLDGLIRIEVGDFGRASSFVESLVPFVILIFVLGGTFSFSYS